MGIEIIPASTAEHEAMVQLIQLQKALSLMKTTRRRAKALRDFKLMSRRGEKEILPPLRKWMKEMVTELQRGLSSMKGKNPRLIAERIVDWDEINRRGQELLKPALLELLTMGGKAVVETRILKQERFDPIGIEAVKWVTDHSAELVVEISETTMLAIRDMVKVGIDAGKTIPQIAKEIRPLVGLHSQYAEAVAKYHMALIEEGVAAADAAASSSRYASRLHRRRTETIARTETAFGLSEGIRQGYDQFGITTLEWVADLDCCDICSEMDGKKFTIAEAEGLHPAHPSCECVWVAA